ncbi:MAG: hypothetical protein M1819_007445 [Sarea resinae]|nr:MAG: hypothetical protein M1819_007445 [Sarea resinae]
MAPVDSSVPDTEKRLKVALSFATGLPKRLQSDASDASLSADLQRHITDFPTRFSASSLVFEDIDTRGTNLWNLATRLNREDTQKARTAVSLAARMFALLLLDCAQQSPGGTVQNCLRLLKVAIKTAKHCLDHTRLDLCAKASQKATKYEDEISHADGFAIDASIRTRLSHEHFVLRLALAWRQNRLDLLEDMVSKNGPDFKDWDPSLAESLADLMFEIGKDLLKKKQFALAVKWLDRSFDVLMGQELERLSDQAGELRISILYSSVKALLGTQQEEGRARARHLVDLLEIDFGEKLVVLLLRMDIISTAPKFDSSEYFGVLQRVIRVFEINPTNIRTVMHDIHKLKNHSPNLACKAVDELLETRLYSMDTEEWIERAFITRLWIIADIPESEDVLDQLSQVCDSLSMNLVKPLSASATHAAQILLWKRIESLASQQQYLHAQTWCRLALHTLFQNSGDMNMAKISSHHDLASAREAYSQMSQTAKDAPMTKYLMYKVAIRTGDTDLAAECLNAVCCSTSKDATLVYACVLEAQRLGNRAQTVAALEKVLEKYNYAAPKGVNLPALLRYVSSFIETLSLTRTRVSARLLMSEIADSKVPDLEAIGKLCKLFEGAAVQAKSSKRDRTATEQMFPVSELDWFSKNSYNVSLKYCTDWDPHIILRFLQACINFICLYPDEVEKAVSEDLSSRRMFCNFLSTCVLVVLARSEDDIETQLQHYLRLRSHASEFRRGYSEQIERAEFGGKDDLVQKYSSVLSFDFEAAVRLKAWDDLGSIVEECRECDLGVFGVLADVMLCSQAPTPSKNPVSRGFFFAGNLLTSPALISILQHIITATTQTHPHQNLPRLARWIRCLFQLTLPSAIAIAERALDQAVLLAQDSQTTRRLSNQPMGPSGADADADAENDKIYPATELEWLASTTFNRAIDFFCAADDEACRAWAEKALALAAALPEGDGRGQEGGGGGKSLYEIMQEKYMGLRWSEASGAASTE